MTCVCPVPHSHRVFCQGKYADAEKNHRRALDITEKVLGLDHPDVAAGLNNLAWLFQSQVKVDSREVSMVPQLQT